MEERHQERPDGGAMRWIPPGVTMATVADRPEGDVHGMKESRPLHCLLQCAFRIHWGKIKENARGVSYKIYYMTFKL